LSWALLVIAAYLVGSVPFGIIVGKLAKGVDLRDQGSGNIGAANAIRTLGPVLGIMVLAGDVLKGSLAVYYLPTLLGPFSAGDLPTARVIAALLAIIGHNYSVFLGFKGGKGIATSLGALLCLDYRAALVGVGLWIVLVGLTRFSSVGSMVGSASIPIWMFATRQPAAYKVFAVLAALFAIYKHRANIGRLMAGTENRLF